MCNLIIVHHHIYMCVLYTLYLLESQGIWCWSPVHEILFLVKFIDLYLLTVDVLARQRD